MASTLSKIFRLWDKSDRNQRCAKWLVIRDENGKWWPLDAYVKARTEAELTHTICDDCQDLFYSDL
jgi:hypothetical protein